MCIGQFLYVSIYAQNPVSVYRVAVTVHKSVKAVVQSTFADPAIILTFPVRKQKQGSRTNLQCAQRLAAKGKEAPTSEEHGAQ
jgi:hypothetical protein